jgi:nucleoside-diphosphate-sugar epimerase
VTTILLTGSTGFLGARIAEELRSRGLDWRPLCARLHEVQPAHLSAARAVIHCAALTPGRALSDEDFFEVNVAGTQRLLKLCEGAGVGRFVCISSMGVKFPSAYTRSKLLAEESVKQSRLAWLVLRPAHIYGPTRQLRGTFQKLKRKLIWSVPGSGRNPIHIVYVKDCAAAIVDATLSPRARETLNIIGPEYSELDYVRVLRRVTGSKAVIVPTPLFWARMRKGKLAIEARAAGLRMPGVADWAFTPTPLEDGMREVYGSFEAERG